MSPFRRSIATGASVLLLCLAACPSSLAAADQWSSEMIELNIPAQPLEKALDAFSYTTGVQLLYDTSIVAGRRSTAVVGKYAPQQALLLLLSGTGLKAHYSAASAVTLTRDDKANVGMLTMQPMRVEAARPLLESNSRFMGYAAQVRDILMRSVQANPVTNVGRYRITLRVWVSAQGKVEQVEQSASSGDANRDAEIVNTLRSVAGVPPPPQGMPQPILLRFEAQTR